MQDRSDLTHSYAEVVAHDDEASEQEVAAAFAVPVAYEINVTPDEVIER